MLTGLDEQRRVQRSREILGLRQEKGWTNFVLVSWRNRDWTSQTVVQRSERAPKKCKCGLISSWPQFLERKAFFPMIIYEKGATVTWVILSWPFGQGGTNTYSEEKEQNQQRPPLRKKKAHIQPAQAAGCVLGERRHHCGCKRVGLEQSQRIFSVVSNYCIWNVKVAINLREIILEYDNHFIFLFLDYSCGF